MAIIKDQLYIDKVIKGNVNAFAHLVDAYKNMVFSLAFKMTKNRKRQKKLVKTLL